MILYNMRYRGPYEYDKFVLNTLQISNAISLSETNELKANKLNSESLLVIENNINKLYKNFIGTENKKGICDILYEQSYEINGGN